jgi:hypothetical protein
VVVAVVTVRMVQMIADEIIDVVAVGHGFMTATGAMHVAGIMPGTALALIAGIRKRVVDRQRVLVHMIAVRAMQVPVVKVACVAFVNDRRMAAAGPVAVGVIGVGWMACVGHLASWVWRIP